MTHEAGGAPGCLGALGSGAADLVRAAVRVVVPVECPVCGRPDRRLCPGCAGVLAGPLRRCDAGARALDGTWPVWSLGPYAGGLRALVLAWKAGGRTDLGAELGGAMAAAGAAWAERHPGGELWVVPAPSGRSRRRRGRPPVTVLAAGFARGAAAAGRPTRVADVLRRTGRGQAGRGARARAAAARTGTRLVVGLPRGAACVVVDDVVTTGATLAACRAAVAAGGTEVLGAFVVAAASLRSADQGDAGLPSMHGAPDASPPARSGRA